MLQLLRSPIRRIGILTLIAIATLVGSVTMLKHRQQHLQNVQDILPNRLYIAIILYDTP